MRGLAGGAERLSFPRRGGYPVVNKKMASDPFPRPFGKYTLMSHLAVGGMADVYLATQRGPAGFEKDCVIKLILPTLAQDEAFVRMFLDEARIAARLSHPNIVQVFDFGQEGGDYFIALEHVDGLTLERLLGAVAKKGGRGLPWPIAVRIVAGIAEGLDHAHNATASDGSPLHLVHRDVSPTNIVIGWNGVAKILDFGIAKVAAHRFQRNTEVGVVKGKVPYMSPEQIEGLELDARSDVFALGAVLYEATCGVRAFVGETAGEVTQRIAESDPMPPEELNPAFPPDLKPILWRALSKTVEGRYQSARDFKQDLEQFLQEQHVTCSSYDVAACMEELVPRRARGTLLGVGPQRPLMPSPVRADVEGTPSRRTPSPVAPREPARETTMPSDEAGPDGAGDDEGEERPIKPAESSRESRRTPRPAARPLPEESSGALRAASFDLEAEERRHRDKPKGGSSVVMGIIAVLVLITAVVFYILHTRAVQRAEQGAPPPATTPGPAATGDLPAPPAPGTPPKPAGATDTKAAGAPAVKPPEKAPEKTPDKPGDKPAAKAPEKMPDKPGDKPAAKAPEKTADKPPEKAAEKPPRPRPKKADEEDDAPRPLPKLPVPPPADPE
jgi:serine/threonine protein kinase